MYQCPGCGGNLEFNIESQRLKCKYCSQIYDPYVITKESDGYETDSFEATYFTCPQCGGEIYSTDNAAAGFCSFCGASTILSSRIAREKSPDKLIPFKISKEKCKDMYMSKVRRALFAPKYMKNKEAIESFRGIYMPYWKYKYLSNGQVSVNAKKSHRSGDYIITDHYRLNGNIDAFYDGFTYDSSSSFYDNISEEIAPYDLGQSADFTASMLSGFYADVADVPTHVYMSDAHDKAYSNTVDEYCNIPPFKGFEVDKKKADIPIQSNGVERLLFPVWFMSYRHKNRVAYVTINGQTGKMSADIPIDYKKFLFFSLLLTVPIFLMLNFLPAIVPYTLTKVVSILSLITTIIFCIQMNSIVKRQKNLGDQGLNWNKDEVSSRSKKKKKKIKIGEIVIILSIASFTIVPTTLAAGEAIKGLIEIISGVAMLIIYVVNKEKKEDYDIDGLFTVLFGAITVFICGMLEIINPVLDLYYYGAAIFVTLGIFMILSAIMVNYNKLVTRRPPQFNKKGGDDSAY